MGVRVIKTFVKSNTMTQGPTTDYESKKVMIAAERRDHIIITDTIQQLADDVEIPAEVSVVQRTDPYYGPKLLAHATVDGEDVNYLLTAPGPDSQLLLWAGEMNDKGMRKGWYKAAEVTATLAPEQPPYPLCDQCNEPIRTIGHERMSVLGMCKRAETWQEDGGIEP